MLASGLGNYKPVLLDPCGPGCGSPEFISAELSASPVPYWVGLATQGTVIL
jgi:hypothetical protein